MKSASVLLNHKIAAVLFFLSLSVSTALSEVKEEYRESFPLSSNGRISIGNINGSTEVKGWDRDEVSVFAIKKGKTRDIVDRIEINIESDEDSFSLKTKLPKEKTWLFWDSGAKGSVVYEIKVPFGSILNNVSSINGAISIEGVEGDVKASTVNGSVKVYELFGDVDLSAVNGSLRAVYSEKPQSRSIQMEVVNGSLALKVPSNTSGHFKASTVNGGIRSALDLPINKRFPIGANVDARKGGGGPDIRLNSVNGRISIEES